MVVGVVGLGKDAEMLVDCLRTNTKHTVNLINPKLIKNSTYKDPYITYKECDKIINAVNLLKYRNSTYKLIEHNELFTYVDKTAYVNHTVLINEGTFIQPKVIIDYKTKIGRSCWICRGSNIGHDCVIEDNVFIGPGVIICGSVTIRTGSFIGAGTLIYDKVHIKEKSIVRGGTVIDKSR